MGKKLGTEKDKEMFWGLCKVRKAVCRRWGLELRKTLVRCNKGKEGRKGRRTRR